MAYETVRVSARQIDRAKKITGRRSAQAVTNHALRLLLLRGYAKDDGALSAADMKAIRSDEPQVKKPPSCSLFPL